MGTLNKITIMRNVIKIIVLVVVRRASPCPPRLKIGDLPVSPAIILNAPQTNGGSYHCCGSPATPPPVLCFNTIGIVIAR